MAKFISMFNNKGGVGKTTLTWNLADALAEQGKRVLLIDFDPQCNLSIAMLGADNFKGLVANPVAAETIRNFLQGYLQNTGPGSVKTHTGKHTHPNVQIVAGDFWLNVYSDALSVGNDLLTGNGIAKFISLRTLESKLNEGGQSFDYALIDLPPSFGGLVRSALYSSDYLIIPCTSDTFSEYCIGLIAQMLPQFVADWENGVARFKQNNYGSKEYDHLGKPLYAGWIFNGFDTRSDKMLRADKAHHHNIELANKKLAADLESVIRSYDPVIASSFDDYNIGQVEDMNVIIQNSLWQSVPVSKLHLFGQVQSLAGNKQKWAKDQLKRMGVVADQINALASRIIGSM